MDMRINFSQSANENAYNRTLTRPHTSLMCAVHGNLKRSLSSIALKYTINFERVLNAVKYVKEYSSDAD